MTGFTVNRTKVSSNGAILMAFRERSFVVSPISPPLSLISPPDLDDEHAGITKSNKRIKNSKPRIVFIISPP
jgi:hypothetical protein